MSSPSVATAVDLEAFTAEESLVLERIEREFAERQASDTRLNSRLGDLHGAFMAAIKINGGAASE